MSDPYRIIARFLLVIVALSPLLFSQEDLSTSELLAELYADSGWELINHSSNGMRVFNKRVTGSDIPAIMVKQTATVSSAALVSAIQDVGNYLDFLQDVYLKRSDLLTQTPNHIDGYQLFDLPIIANRHTIYRMWKSTDSTGGRIRFEWIVVPSQSEYAEFLDSMDVVYGRPIYLVGNVGGWEIIPLENEHVEVTYRLFVDPGGWVPDFLVTRTNRVTAPRMVQSMIQEATRREKRND